MEYLDIYDENGNFLGKELRDVVHRDALWHKTVHCWLYDKDGNVFFQIRIGEGLYTTASGHVKAGEDIATAFAREIKEELGLDIDASDATFLELFKWVKDMKKKDGTLFRDRCFSHFYADLFEGSYDDFNFDLNEIEGVVLVSARDALELFEKNEGKILGKVIKPSGIIEREIDIKEFFVTPEETYLEKYGRIMQKIIEITTK